MARRRKRHDASTKGHRRYLKLTQKAPSAWGPPQHQDVFQASRCHEILDAAVADSFLQNLIACCLRFESLHGCLHLSDMWLRRSECASERSIRMSDIRDLPLLRLRIWFR